MTKSRSSGLRVRPLETIEFGGTKVTNRTANSIMVRKTTKGVEVTDCCLEEQGK